jgi:hypothetical protein
VERLSSRPMTLGLAVAAWVLLCIVAPGLAGVVVTGLPKSFAWVVAAEAAVMLVLSGVFFIFIRGLKPSRWFALAGPAGYLVSVGVFFLLIWIAGREMNAERGYGIVVAANVAAVTVGAFAGLIIGRRELAAAEAEAAAAEAEAAEAETRPGEGPDPSEGPA